MGKSKFYYKKDDAPKPNRPNHIGATILIEYNDEILLEQRADSDYWAIIGGGLEIEETLLQCAIRETFEETHICVTTDMLEFYNLYDDPSIIIEYPDGNIIRSIMAVFKVKLFEEPHLICSEESRKLKFFTKDELSALKIVETHIPVLVDYLSEI